MDDRAALNDKADAALRSLGIIGEGVRRRQREARRARVRCDIAGPVCGVEEPVRHLDRTDRQRREQLGEVRIGSQVIPALKFAAHEPGIPPSKSRMSSRFSSPDNRPLSRKGLSASSSW